MGTVSTLNGRVDSAAWKQSFTDALIGLCPDLNPDSADEVADAEYGAHKVLGPKSAAALWAARVWGAPGRDSLAANGE